MTPVGEADYFVLLATAGILILAAFADLLDGALARAIKAESAFGGLFDSLADAVSFGVAPSVVVLKTLSLPAGTPLSFFITTAAMVFSVCGVLRLVRFNVVQSHERKEELTLWRNSNKNFTGLPIPAAAAAVISTNLFLISPQGQQWFHLSEEGRTWVLLFLMLFLGYLMISRWKFFSFKALQIRITSFFLVIITVISAAILLWGFIHHFPLLFALLSWAYLLTALSLSCVRIIAGSQSKTLVDFEPDDTGFDE